jgi:oxygen-independent coproporphyrinogen-3 oxidase
VGGVRWWNVRHPTPYAVRVGRGVSPAAGREVLDADTRRTERVLLETRLSDGLPTDVLDEQARSTLPAQAERGLVERHALRRGRVVLTTRGRLLADAVVRDLVS